LLLLLAQKEAIKKRATYDTSAVGTKAEKLRDVLWNSLINQFQSPLVFEQVQKRQLP